MSPLLLLVLRFLHGAGVPVVLCGDHLVVGQGQCRGSRGGDEPAPSSFKEQEPAAHQDDNTISNGF